jgi:hypothetical protein
MNSSTVKSSYFAPDAGRGHPQRVARRRTPTGAARPARGCARLKKASSGIGTFTTGAWNAGTPIRV